MTKEQIKEKVLYDDCGFIRLSEYCVDTILTDYYTPLEASHRELVSNVNDALLLLPFVINATESGTNRNHLTDINIILQTALSNAKKLTNERK